ncbi:MAG: helix-turn-helix domain-containing protein [Helicobacteraceae bacterium]|jgi:transcriptional regulator with XRE-family HTH domain|nr:helix-turn-helix domain-containing protein [Helicobacteraceae bacterium]
MRKRFKISPTDISEKTGVSIPSVCNHLKGKRSPRRETLERYRAAGYPLEPFIFGLDYAREHGISLGQGDQEANETPPSSAQKETE